MIFKIPDELWIIYDKIPQLQKESIILAMILKLYIRKVLSCLVVILSLISRKGRFIQNSDLENEI